MMKILGDSWVRTFIDDEQRILLVLGHKLTDRTVTPRDAEIHQQIPANESTAKSPLKQ